MYAGLTGTKGRVGDTKKVGSFTYTKSSNGKWLLCRDKELKKVLTNLYSEQGLTLRKITEQTGIPHSSLQQAINHFDLMRKKKPMSDEDANAFCVKNKKLLLSMYLEKHMTPQEISEVVAEKTKLPFKFYMLHRFFSELGILKTHSEAIHGAISRGTFAEPKKRGENLFAKHAITSWEYHLDKSLSGLTFEQYKRLVHRFTYMVVSRYPDLFDHGTHRLDRECKDIQLDHQFSKASGYYEYNGKEYVPRKTPVPLDVMCHPCNLKLMSTRSNGIKSSSNHIELDELRDNIKRFTKKHGDIFDGYYEKYTREEIVQLYAQRSKKKVEKLNG